MKKKVLSIVLLAIFSIMMASYITKDSAAVKQEKATKITFIELGSVRCIPCRKMEPVLTDIRKKFPEDVKVIFHDVWTEKGRPFAKKYGIRSIPTQVFLDKEGKEYFRHIGFFPEEEVIKVLKKMGAKK